MRKFLILSITMLLFMASTFIVFADTGISLSANTPTLNAGGNVTITVSANTDSCTQGGIEITYDTKVFTMVSGECNVNNADIKYFDANAGDGGFAFEKATELSGTIFTFTLHANESATPCDSAVTVKFKTNKDATSNSITLKIACVHKYDNDCDTTCNACQATREIKHKWDDGTVTKKATCTAEGETTYTCTVCHATQTKSVAKLTHTYDNACDETCNLCNAKRDVSHDWKQLYDTTNHWMKCNLCGKTKDIAKHNTPSTYITTSKTHGYKCKDCGAMIQEERHKFDNDCDTSCSVCQYVRAITHNYSTKWVYDENKHWHECTVCGDKLEALSHKPGPKATEASAQICTECGYVIAPAQVHKHTMAGDWLNDTVGHWYRCACGELSASEPHTFGDEQEKNGKLISVCTECGYEYIKGNVTTVPVTNVTVPIETTPAQTTQSPETTLLVPQLSETQEPLKTPQITTQPTTTQKPTPQLTDTTKTESSVPWKQIAICAIVAAALSIAANVILIAWIVRRNQRNSAD